MFLVISLSLVLACFCVVLRPLNVKARLILAMKPREDNFQRPLFDIKVDLDEISLNLNRDQYSDLLDLLEFQDYLSVKSKYIKYHLKKEIEEKPTRKNWKFAYEAIVNEEIRPRFECYKWENIKAHLERCREYRAIHLQELTGKLTTVQKEREEVNIDSDDDDAKVTHFSSTRNWRRNWTSSI